jgi:peptidoglycan/LPS O-acetylase OafA/YrhL
MTGATHRGLAYRPDLDGLRALAIGLVLLDHARIGLPAGIGNAGVTAFFVLSGFLITSLLRSEQLRTGTIRLRAFWMRRVRRLGPALVVMLAWTAVTGAMGVWAPGWAAALVATLLYVANWAYIVGFDADPLGHTWSLSIEEQFYAVWPLLVRWFSERGIVILAIAGIVVAAVAREWTDGPAEYYSTFTRADALLIGCLAAIRGLRVPRAAGFLGILLIVVAGSTTAVPVVAEIGALLVVAARVELLGFFAPVGRRAYSMYLWNWPIALLATGLVSIPLTFLAAELSYRLVERRYLAASRRRGEAPGDGGGELRHARVVGVEGVDG